MSSSTIADTVGRWGESLDDFSDDEENIVPITEDDDIHLLDTDDVETIVADANGGNDLDVEDDVWSAAIARLGLRNEKPVWGYVGPETEQPVPSCPAYEPPSRMYDVNYTEMRDREHQDRVFGSSSSSNYGELVLKAQFETQKRSTACILVASIRNQFGYIPSYYKAWMAKQKAMAQVYGDWDKLYNELPTLLRAMQIFIPGTKVEYETKVACNLQGEVIHGKMIFSKLFWAFNACIEGFPFCKCMIQVDGTWLYGKYGHILLIAVAQDGDSNIFPVAFAIVEKEDAEGWEFFLKHLRNHVVKEDGVCMISDRGTALLSLIDKDESLWKSPHAYPAYCVRHIAANAKTRFGNNQIRKEILCAGRRYGHMTTNLAEAIIYVLKGTRHLPIARIVWETYFRLGKVWSDKGQEVNARLNNGQIWSQTLQDRMISLQLEATSMRVRTFDPNGYEFSIEAMVRGA
ncbi:hypothetical protein GQ457_16G023140 [Hibiscus cannabinus]